MPDIGTIDPEANPTRKRAEIHGVPAALHVGNGTFGMMKLREEQDADNELIQIPLAGRPSDPKARFKREKLRPLRSPSLLRERDFQPPPQVDGGS